MFTTMGSELLLVSGCSDSYGWFQKQNSILEKLAIESNDNIYASLIKNIY